MELNGIASPVKAMAPQIRRPPRGVAMAAGGSGNDCGGDDGDLYDDEDRGDATGSNQSDGYQQAETGRLGALPGLENARSVQVRAAHRADQTSGPDPRELLEPTNPTGGLYDGDTYHDASPLAKKKKAPGSSTSMQKQKSSTGSKVGTGQKGSRSGANDVRRWSTLFEDRTNTYTHIMNDQSPLESGLRARLTDTIRAEESARGDPMDLQRDEKDLYAKEAYQEMTRTWKRFREHAKVPAVRHVQDWSLRIQRFAIISKAVEKLDRGFFARRQEDRDTLWQLENQVKASKAPSGPIPAYEAIVQSWWHHVAIVSHFGRSSVKYLIDGNDQLSNTPSYRVPFVSGF